MANSDEVVEATAYAKINWALDVLHRRPDGYHEVASVMQRLELADNLTFSPGGQGIRLTVTGPESEGVPSDSRNIVWRAAQLLHAADVDITVDKRIPNQAGLGGGSSDAATALVALNKMLGRGLNLSELIHIGSKLGADVPFFLAQSTAKVSGFGEAVTVVPSPEPVDVVLIKPDVGVSTADAYRALDNLPGRVSKKSAGLWPNASPSNDFEEVIYTLYPGVAVARDALIEAGASTTLLCGSGAAVMTWGAGCIKIYNDLFKAGNRKIWLTRTL